MNIGIIGGGAAGMMAAITAAGKGHTVTILEHSPRLGKKLLMTGNGRCNFSNRDMDISHFHSDDINAVSDVLSKFSLEKTLRTFKDMGICSFERDGYLYPYSQQASSVVQAFLMELEKYDVNVVLDCDIKDIRHRGNDNSFVVDAGNCAYIFDKLIIATGSYAAPKTGSDGSMYTILKKFNFKMKKPLPALCSLYCDDKYLKLAAGVRCMARLSVNVDENGNYADKLNDADGSFVKEEYGQLQITEYGISGIPAFQLSHIIARALDENKEVSVTIDFLPDFTYYDVESIISTNAVFNPSKKVGELLIGSLNYKLNKVIMKHLDSSDDEIKKDIGIDISDKRAGKQLISNTKCSDIDMSRLEKYLTDILRNYKVRITRTNTFENAQVCTGGILLSELKPTLESKKVPGLYFAGEILDVNGDCGGYNLQWAWSSGYVAGSVR